MVKYIFKRLLQIIPTFLLLTLLVYTILSFAPADPALMRLGGSATPEQIAEVNHELGLDQPLLIRYGKYMWELITKAEKSQKVDDILKLVGIPPERKHEYPFQFSGGMKQRIGIAIIKN